MPCWACAGNFVSNEKDWQVLGSRFPRSTGRVNFVGLAGKSSFRYDPSFCFNNYRGYCLLAHSKQVILCLALGSLY